MATTAPKPAPKPAPAPTKPAPVPAKPASAPAKPTPAPTQPTGIMGLPSVQANIAAQKQKDIETGRATQVTIVTNQYGQGTVVSARNAGGGSVPVSQATKTIGQIQTESAKAEYAQKQTAAAQQEALAKQATTAAAHVSRPGETAAQLTAIAGAGQTSFQQLAARRAAEAQKAAGPEAYMAHEVQYFPKTAQGTYAGVMTYGVPGIERPKQPEQAYARDVYPLANEVSAIRAEKQAAAQEVSRQFTFNDVLYGMLPGGVKQGISKTQQWFGTNVAAPFTTWREGITAQFESRQLEYMQAGVALQGKPPSFKKYGIGLGYAGLNVFRGAATPILYPKETAAGALRLLYEPMKVAGEMGTSFAEAPVATTFQFGGQALFFKGAGLAAGKILPKPPLKGQIATAKSAPYVVEDFLTKTVAKRGNIASADISVSDITFRTQGKVMSRVAPTTYAKVLASEGKIVYRPEINPLKYSDESGAISRLFSNRKYVESYSPTKTGLEIATSHELIHYKTPEISQLQLPGYSRGGLMYRLSPGEVLAFGGEKLFAKRGFGIETSRVVDYFESTKANIGIRSTADLKFEYTRMQLPERTIGKGTPSVSISQGVVQQGAGTFFNRFAVRVGRGYTETLTGKQADIFMIKKGRNLTVKQLSVEAIAGGKRSVSTTMPGGMYGLDLISTKVVGKVSRFEQLASQLGSVGRTVLKTERRPFQLERVSMPLKSINKVNEQFFDIGTKEEGGIEIMSKRMFQRDISGVKSGAAKGFTGVRDINRAYLGLSKARNVQVDMVGKQVEVSVLGKEKTITIKPVGIEYVDRSAVYKPNIRIVGMEKGLKETVPFSKSIKRGTLATERIFTGRAESFYAFEEGRVRPLKAAGAVSKVVAYKSLKAASDLFRSKRGSLTMGKLETGLKGETIESQLMPKRSISPGRTVGISTDILRDVLAPQRRTPYAFPLANINRSQIYSKANAALSNVPVGMSRTYTPSISRTFTPSKTYTPTMQYAPVISRTFTPTMTYQAAESMTQTQEITQVVTPTITPITPIPFTPIPPVPPPPTPQFFMFNPMGMPRAEKKRKRGKIKQRYLPSLMALDLRLFGRPGKNLTGLEMRPVIKGMRGI